MSSNIAHFAVKSIGLSRVNGRKPCTLLEAARHNLREIQAELGATGHIDPRRSHHNDILSGPPSSAEVQALANSLLIAAGIKACKLRRDHCQAIEAVFSLPQDATIHNTADYFSKCLSWLDSATSLPVLSAVVHRDESAMHLHVLLLPVKGGTHVGSKPIDHSALKSLRESFFNQVAGPAGLQRTSAKFRGIVKQWAVEAVLGQCEALGLPAANGPIWPVFVDAIKRDPTEAVAALGIDAHTIREAGKLQPPNPIGIDSNPIGIQKKGAKHQTLSCVGIADSKPSKPHPHTINSLAELWTVAGSHSQSKASCSSRLDIARAAQQRAITRYASKSPRPAPAPAVRVDEDGLTREHDEYAHDLSAWDEPHAANDQHAYGLDFPIDLGC